jgi:hypothetical protein
MELIGERYFFACEAGAVNKGPLRDVIALLRGDELRAIIDTLPGYDSGITGTVIELEQAFGSN